MMQLAKRLGFGVTDRAIEKWEKNQNRPTESHRRRIIENSSESDPATPNVTGESRKLEGWEVATPTSPVVLFFLGGLASTAKSEAVLPAYLIGLVVAGVFLRDKTLVHRMRAASPSPCLRRFISSAPARSFPCPRCGRRCASL